MIIYKTTNLVTGKIYIGQDSHNDPKYLGSGSYLIKSIKKYGRENFGREVITYCNSKEELNLTEQFYIKFFNSKIPNGYNLTDGGEGIMNPSEETREKMSKAKKGKYLGEDNPAFKRAKGKTYEEIYGKEKATLLKENLRRKRQGKTYIELFGKEEAKDYIKRKKEMWTGKSNPMFGRKNPSLSKRNKENNPMKDPEIARRNGDSKRGKKKPKLSERMKGIKRGPYKKNRRRNNV